MYCQVLIPIHRYKLLEQLAVKRGVKVTALVRDLTFGALETAYGPAEYQAAADADAAAWTESVRKRVEGRKRAKQTTPEAEVDA